MSDQDVVLFIPEGVDNLASQGQHVDKLTRPPLR